MENKLPIKQHILRDTDNFQHDPRYVIHERNGRKWYDEYPKQYHAWMAVKREAVNNRNEPS